MRRFTRLLSVLGSAGAVAILSVVHARLIADPPYSLTGTFRFSWAVGYMALLALATYVVGLPDQARSTGRTVRLSFIAGAGAALVVSIVQLLVGDALLPRFVVVGAAVLQVPWQVAVAALDRAGSSREEDRDRVVLVAAPEERDRLAADLLLEPERGAVVLHGLTDDEAAVPSTLDGIGSTATLLVLDRHALSNDAVVEQAGKLHEAGVRVRPLETFYEEWLGKLPLSELRRTSLFFDVGEVHRVGYARAKRVMDIVVAMIGVVALILLLPMVVVGNLIGNRGSLFFRQRRVGKGGAPFTIYKFRTMRSDATGEVPTDASGAWTELSDPRVTPFGRMLRRTHVDELPQVWNILRGDLAVVGPRPEQPHYVETLRRQLEFYEFRHLVRPGLTGWAQVKYGYAGDQRGALEKLQYEFFYLRHQNLWFDLRIILRTFRSVVGGPGRGR